jgi:hypothetical protein
MEAVIEAGKLNMIILKERRKEGGGLETGTILTAVPN